MNTRLLVGMLLVICVPTLYGRQYSQRQSMISSGGGRSSSSGYTDQVIVSQPSVGTSSSSGYEGGSGFWYQYSGLVDITQFTQSVAGGWNMLSVPRTVSDYRKSILYPGASSSAFIYQHQYVVRDTLTHGAGYWLKFPAGQPVNLRGGQRLADTIHVVAGWNMIGSIGSAVNTVAIVKIPQDMVTSNYFGYNGTYQIASSIVPGLGYWVKCNVPGLLMLTTASAAPAVAVAVQQEPGGSRECNTLTVTLRTEEANPPSQTLLFGRSLPEGTTPETYVLPPPPPGGLDVRFATNRYAEFFSGGETALKELPLSIRTDGPTVTLSWAMNEKSGQAYLLVEKQWGKIIAQHRLINTGTVTLRDVEKKTFGLTLEELPAAYALAQNYPNPFNPTTVIRYSLPVNAHVTLRVYDMLGREVATLLDREQAAGFQSVEWNALDYAGGVYWYRLQAGPFTETKKLMLMK